MKAAADAALAALSLPPPPHVAAHVAMPKVKLPRKIRDLAKKANGGCGKAAWKLAGHYLNGTGGVEKNDELVRHWLVKGAELGNVEAQSGAGTWFADKGDYDTARKWLEKAAAQGSVYAMNNLGVLYQNGKGVERNRTTAGEWWEKAAANGNEAAKENLLRHFGDDDASVDRVPRDSARGDDHSVDREAEVKLPRNIRDLVKKANGGCASAANELAWHYHDGTGGVEKNEELERHWLEKGAELGDVEAQNNFGMMLDGEGDYEGARRWWELAAAQGDVIAMSNIAQLYANGEGVEKNISTAAEWFLKAAMKGNHESQFNYGYHLAKNLKQYAEGALWYERSAAQGNVRAMNELGTLYLRGDGVEQNVSKAREMWEKAAANSSDEMWEKAAANGNEAAKTNLQALAAEGNADAHASRRRLLSASLTTLARTRTQQTIAKKQVLEQVVELTGVNISDETFESLVTEPLRSAVGFYKHLALFHKQLALCFLHGTGGLEKNLRMAKEMFKVAEIYDPDDATVAEELVKLRSCVTCGKLDARWGCKLCRGVRYCDKRCQLRDWHRGIERRPPHRETCSRVVNMFPPGYFAVYRETMAPQRDASN